MRPKTKKALIYTPNKSKVVSLTIEYSKQYKSIKAEYHKETENDTKEASNMSKYSMKANLF